MIIALENIRSIYNVGAIIRSCEFFGFRKIALIGYTAFDPIEPDHINYKLKKTSLTTESKVDLERFENIKAIIKKYPDHKLVAVEIDQPNSVGLHDFIPNDKTILAFGNEVEGVSKECIEKASMVIEIPRVGTHQSLNVSSTAAIVLYHCSNTKPE